MKKCPKCKSVSRTRMKRVGVSKYIFSAKAYACGNCNNRYVYLPLLNLSI
tara:strand:+ start:176 stop:325 length:150 start_codon:yes stop_codon:yes gene_type:complete